MNRFEVCEEVVLGEASLTIDLVSNGRLVNSEATIIGDDWMNLPVSIC
ncbi:MAG: hypothetical protein J0I12_05635 [Candidatus Eremiobacteraeota bacterium]|nr:hypothetical protein [Candidatus Eremiobacteraeota bacterium]